MKFRIRVGDNIEERNGDIRQSSYPMKGELSRSKLQENIGILLKEKFNLSVILEDWNIPGTKMYLDFLIMPNKIAIEVQGSQHYSINSLFHSSPIDFAKQKVRDSYKKDFCKLNGIKLVEVNDKTISIDV